MSNDDDLVVLRVSGGNILLYLHVRCLPIFLSKTQSLKCRTCFIVRDVFYDYIF